MSGIMITDAIKPTDKSLVAYISYNKRLKLFN